jgi:hypothetical protein
MTPEQRAQYAKSLIDGFVRYASMTWTSRQSNRVLLIIMVLGTAYMMWG